MQADVENRSGCHDAPSFAIADLVTDGVLVCAGSEVVHANAAAAAIFGREGEASALIGAQIEALLTPAPARTSEPTASPQSARVIGLRNERRVEVRSRAIGEHEVHVLVDVAVQARPHAALLETSRDLMHARLEAAALQSRLDAEVEERRELVGVVAHELRTPITVIRGYARLLLAGKVGDLNPEQRRFIEASAGSCDRLDDFVAMLLRATDAQRAADAYHFSDASLGKLLTGVVEFLRPVIEQSGMRVEVELDREALWATFDAPRVEQVLVNLISNGLRYATEGEVLTVRTRKVESSSGGRGEAGSRDSVVEVSVSDAGPGIPAERRETIFDPYVRGEAAATVPGLGLGLAISRRIIEDHGGSLELREEPGGGCCFAFTLAAAEPKDPVDHPAPSTPGDR